MTTETSDTTANITVWEVYLYGATYATFRSRERAEAYLAAERINTQWPADDWGISETTIYGDDDAGDLIAKTIIGSHADNDRRRAWEEANQREEERSRFAAFGNRAAWCGA